MAIRTKTIEYAFPHWTGSSITPTNPFTSSAITIYIPETGSRTILNAHLFLFSRDDIPIVAGVSPTNTKIGMILGANNITTSVGTGFWADTGEQVGQGMYSDVTDVFVDTFTSNVTESNAQSLWWAETSSYGNIASKVVITYAYDDTNLSRKVKTVVIPLQSKTSSISDVISYIDKIPALETFCPEANKVFKSVWIEAEGNSGNNTTSDTWFGIKIGNDPVWYSNTYKNSGNSSTYNYIIYKPDSFDTSLEQSMSAVMSGSTGAGFNNFCPTVYATYEYDLSQTTKSLVSIQLPWEMPSQVREAPIAGPVHFYRDIMIVGERITQSICAARTCYTVNATPSNVYFKCDNQTAQLYTVNAGAATCGMLSFQHRFDENAFAGQGSTIQKGKSNLSYFFSNTGTIEIFNVNGLSILNYICDTPSMGDDALSNTTQYILSNRLANVNYFTSSNFAPTISESYYWINGIGYSVCFADGNGVNGYNINVEITGSDNLGVFHGWSPAYADTKLSDTEKGYYVVNCSARDLFKLYPQYPKNDRIDVSIPRKIMISTAQTLRCTSKFLFTKHSITSLISGSITGYSGDGSGIVVQAFQSGSGDHILETTSSVGGQFQMVWYDDTIPVFVSAYQNNTKVGRSGYYTASLQY